MALAPSTSPTANNCVKRLIMIASINPTARISALSNSLSSYLPDATGAWFRDRLVAAAKRGVTVRLLMDGYGCFALGPSWRRPLRKAGVSVAEFLPMRSALLQPVNLRNHRKIALFDGERAIVGGMNLADEYMGPYHRVARPIGARASRRGRR